MPRARVIRLLGHLCGQYSKVRAEEERLEKIQEERMREQAKFEPRKPKRIPHSRIPAILALHKELNSIRHEINTIRQLHPHSTKLEHLEVRYHKIDELLMTKLKEE